jgi:hypothetical protein
MMQGVADFAFDCTARVFWFNQFQAIGTTMFDFIRKLQMGVAFGEALPFWFDRLLCQRGWFAADP